MTTFWNVNHNGKTLGSVACATDNEQEARAKAADKFPAGDIAELQRMKYVYMGGGYCLIPA